MRKKCVILGSGPSLNELTDLDILELSRHTIICVNGAILRILRIPSLPIDNIYFFSLDPSEKNIERLKLCHEKGIECHFALGNETVPFPIHRYTRVATEYILPANDNTPEYWFKRWSCTPGMQDDKDKISTGNSAAGGVNLAYHMGAKKILIVGVDASTGYYDNSGSPNDLSHLPMLFSSYKSQLDDNGIEVRIAGDMNSDFDKIDIRTGMKWIEE